MVLSPCRNQSGLPSSIEIDLQISGITRLFQQLSPNTLGLLHVIPFHFPSQKTRIKQTTSLEWWLKKSAIHETKLVFATFEHQPQLHGRPAWRFLKAKADSLIFWGWWSSNGWNRPAQALIPTRCSWPALWPFKITAQRLVCSTWFRGTTGFTMIESRWWRSPSWRDLTTSYFTPR